MSNPEETAKHAARELLRRLDQSAECPLNDIRLPPPDVFQHLADYQIHRHDIAKLCEHVRKHYPSVVRIDCGIDSFTNVPEFDVQMSPYTDTAAETYQEGLRIWLKGNYPLAIRFGVYCMPPLNPNRIRASTTIYEAAHSPTVGATNGYVTPRR